MEFLNSPAEAQALVDKTLAQYGSPLSAWIFIRYSWSMDPRGDPHRVTVIAEELLLRMMDRAQHQIARTLLGMSTDYEEAMDLAHQWMEEHQRYEQEAEVVKQRMETKPRKKFPWHMLSAREEEALARRRQA